MASHSRSLYPFHFFKFIFKFNLETIRIPTSFIEKHGDFLPNPVFLKPPNGKKWEVYWTKDDDNEFWFQKGWKEFSRFYSLDVGYVVMFKYEGTPQLDVQIFDPSALEIDYPPTLHSTGGKSLFMPRNPRAVEEAVRFNSNNNPFFTITITSGNLQNSKPNVPTGFFTTYMTKNDWMIEMGNRSWPVKIIPHGKKKRFKFSGGWRLFARESELQVGDICIFELIQKENDQVLQAHIFKSHG